MVSKSSKDRVVPLPNGLNGYPLQSANNQYRPGKINECPLKGTISVGNTFEQTIDFRGHVFSFQGSNRMTRFRGGSHNANIQ